MKKILLVLLLVATQAFALNDVEHKNISQAVFALDVVDRVPQNIISELDNSHKKIFFYTNLKNLSGKKIKHRWSYNDRNMAEISFFPKSNRWRVYSSKNLWKNWTGAWKVDVIDENENIILTKTFNYIQK